MVELVLVGNNSRKHNSMQEISTLNLARKWRPQTFDHVVGQDIPVRMLKNSLYLKKFFPVYLFAGQRGCGKTTSARIFAAAVNCHNLPAFQADPTQPIPCLTCTSCMAMARGDHPDFIEIDAASHTGVDNVRQIIESSSYLPLMGQKKVYLIDEAHMLSKAAFNAFLKILEEPPMTVMFMLATTETAKIPTTVLSRCFTLNYPAISNDLLKKHLQHICSNEGVVVDDDALDILLHETEGSARDAINLLERVRFSGDHITENTVLHVLGKMSSGEIVTLLEGIVYKRPEEILQHLQTINFYTRSAQALWDLLVVCCRSLLWIKYGVKNIPLNLRSIAPSLERSAADCSVSRIHAMLTLLWNQEALFNQTNKKHLLLETVLLQLAEQINIVDLSDLINGSGNNPSGGFDATPAKKQLAAPTAPVMRTSAPTPVIIQAPTPTTTTSTSTPIPAPDDATDPTDSNDSALWTQFIEKIKQATDPMLASILGQAIFNAADPATGRVSILLSNNSGFFKTAIEGSTNIWKPLLSDIFGPSFTNFEFVTTGNLPVKETRPPVNYPAPAPRNETPKASAPTQNAWQPRPQGYAGNSSQRQAPTAPADYLVIKDPQEWPVASLLLSNFSGKIKKITTVSDT